MTWARYHPNGYECSSKGDKRFSALFATLVDGRTIEEAYQLDVKGYRAFSDDWRVGKGKPPVFALSKEELWNRYLQLWRGWVVDNPEVFAELREIAKTKVLTDQFATSMVNQAHALSDLIDEADSLEKLPFTF